MVYQDTIIWERNRIMQEITSTNCPTIRTRVNDARDNRSYYIQKLADGKCWMLTNLAYAGDGENTYNDVKSITNSETLSYSAPYYMIPPGSNVTNGTSSPSSNTNGTGQFGYLYNWCAAMGGQADACQDISTIQPDQTISICPEGWHLPTGSSTGEFASLVSSLGWTSGSPTPLLANALLMYGGYWVSTGSFMWQGSGGYYWTSTVRNLADAYGLGFSSSNVNTSNYNTKTSGYAVRCVAN